MKVNTRMGNKMVKEQKLTLVEVRMIGEWKDGVRNGQGTYTQYGSLLYPDGRKYVGAYKNGKEWNGTYYDINGKKEYKLVNGEIE